MLHEILNHKQTMKIEDKSWYKHLKPETELVDEENFYNFYRTLHERNEIWIRRFIDKQERPWTSDKILRDYKFTNSYRELDRASQWLVNNVLTDHRLSLEDLIFRIMVYRFFNQPCTFDKKKSPYAIVLPHYDNFDKQDLWEQVVTYREKVDNPWHTAYLMNPGASKPNGWNKRGLFRDDMYVNNVLQQVHDKIPEIVLILKKAKRPEEIVAVLETILAVSGFMSHEFYLDFCYCAKYWKQAIMKFTQNDFTNVGPGCSTGLRIIFPRLEKKRQVEGIHWLLELLPEVYEQLGLEFRYIHWNKEDGYHVNEKVNNLTLHTIEFWLCEYQKYWKMNIGEGKQRSKFKPKTKID
jgi:hypothetical protein